MPCCRPAELEWFACKAMNAGKEAAQAQLTHLAGKLLEVSCSSTKHFGRRSTWIRCQRCMLYPQAHMSACNVCRWSRPCMTPEQLKGVLKIL